MDSPAAQLRRILGAMRSEGIVSFDFAWGEALHRVTVDDEAERVLWEELLDRHEGAWKEAWAGDWTAVSAVIVPALERLSSVRQ